MTLNKVLGAIWLVATTAGVVAIMRNAAQSWDYAMGSGRYNLLIDLAWLSMMGVFGLALYRGYSWARPLGFVVVSLLTVWGLLYLGWRGGFIWFWFEYALYPVAGILVGWTWWFLIFRRI